MPVSADEVENGEAAFVRRASSEGMGEINQRAFAPTGNGGRDAPSSPARERRSPAGAALGTDSFLASDGFLAAFLPAASFAEVAGGAAGVGDGAGGTTSTCVKRVSALASLDFGESIYDVAALGSGKPDEGSTLNQVPTPRDAPLVAGSGVAI